MRREKRLCAVGDVGDVAVELGNAMEAEEDVDSAVVGSYIRCRRRMM